MIALDSSAIVAIALDEPEAEAYTGAIVAQGAVVGTPTLVECRIVLAARIPAFAIEFMKRFIERPSIRSADFTFAMYALAAAAFDRFGRGRHAAGLNFGDCLAYAVARHHEVPLLYKGGDFSLTDIRPALP